MDLGFFPEFDRDLLTDFDDLRPDLDLDLDLCLDREDDLRPDLDLDLRLDWEDDLRLDLEPDLLERLRDLELCRLRDLDESLFLFLEFDLDLFRDLFSRLLDFERDRSLLEVFLLLKQTNNENCILQQGLSYFNFLYNMK